MAIENGTTLVGAGLAIWGSKDLMLKLLGPTVDYLGGEIESVVKKCNVNLDRIFTHASKKLGPKLDNPGQVSPRVLKHVLDEGRFCEDELLAEYYGGMLAASRTENGSDDKCIPMLSKIKQMSSLQIRMHYIFYYQVLTNFQNTNYNLGMETHQRLCTVHFPTQAIDEIFGPLKRSERSWDMMTHSVIGLYNLGLISAHGYGEVETLQRVFKNVKSKGVCIDPNCIGAELFMWAAGQLNPDGHHLFSLDVGKLGNTIEMPKGVQPVTAYREDQSTYL